MRILFLTDNFPPETNAAANRVHERARFWAEWGHEITVVTSAPNFPQGKLYEGYENSWYRTERMDDIKVVRVKTFITPNEGTFLRALDFLSFLFTGFAASLVQRRPDVVVATSPQFFTAVAGWLVGIFRRVPFVFELGDIWPASILAVGAMRAGAVYRMLEWVELLLYRTSASVVALSPAFKRNLMNRGIDGGKVAVVMNGVDLSLFAPGERADVLAREWGLGESFVVGYLGTHGMAHALGNVLDAAEILRDRPRIRFLFVGDGAKRTELIAAARARDLNNVLFLPSQPRDMMSKVWSVCDVALVHLRAAAAFSEVIPSKIFEAMAMGLPVLLAAPQGAASRILLADRAGLAVPAEDPDALAAAVVRLAEGDDLRAELARNALTASVKYSRRRQAEEMLQVLEIASFGWGDRAAVGSGDKMYFSP